MLPITCARRHRLSRRAFASPSTNASAGARSAAPQHETGREYGSRSGRRPPGRAHPERLRRNEALPGTGLTAEAFWDGLARIVADFAPAQPGAAGRARRLQAQIDAWHLANRGQAPRPRRLPHVPPGDRLPAARPGPVLASRPQNVDAEIAHIAGPQLVVPVSNARYALNAGNARWGSLYDALYGTDAIPDQGEAPRAAAASTRPAASSWSPAPARSWTTPPRSPRASHARRDGLRDRRRRARRRDRGRHHRPARPRPVRRLSGRARRRRPPCCSSTTACTSN